MDAVNITIIIETQSIESSFYCIVNLVQTPTHSLQCQRMELDIILIIPTDPTKTARGIAEVVKKIGGRKPILASWMGGHGVTEGRAILDDAGIPTYDYPDSAAEMFTYMWVRHYNHNWATQRVVYSKIGFLFGNCLRSIVHLSYVYSRLFRNILSTYLSSTKHQDGAPRCILMK